MAEHSPPQRRRVQCADCGRKLHKELQRLAGSTDWVAEAVAEHEILFIAAQLGVVAHALTDIRRMTYYCMKIHLGTYD